MAAFFEFWRTHPGNIIGGNQSMSEIYDGNSLAVGWPDAKYYGLA